MAQSKYNVKNSNPQDYQVEFTERVWNPQYYLDQIIDLKKRKKLSVLKSWVVLSYKDTSDEYDQNYEAITLRFNCIKDTIPQLIDTFSFSYIVETEDQKVEHQFLLDTVSRRVLFQRKFLDDRYNSEVNDYEFEAIRQLFVETNFVIIV